MGKTLRLVVVCGALVLVARTVSAQSFARPADIIYSYEANAGEDAVGNGSDFDALDGTFSHDNGSDEWDGSAIGEGRPGGAMVIDGTYLRMQETGDPRDHGLDDPSNRKLYFGHDLSADGASGTLLDDGVTLYFRARVPTDGPLDDIHPNGGGAITPYPAGGDGYGLHSGGKGNIGIKESGGGIISFSLETEGADAGLQMPGNHLDIDVTQWHDYYVTIEAGGAGTHQVSIYVDGNGTPETFDVSADDGSDYDGITYLALGMGSTGASGALDVDFVVVAPGVEAPGGAAEVPLASAWGLGLLGLLLAAGAYVVLARRRLAPAAG